MWKCPYAQSEYQRCCVTMGFSEITLGWCQMEVERFNFGLKHENAISAWFGAVWCHIYKVQMYFIVLMG